jgi:hypothetical protein
MKKHEIKREIDRLERAAEPLRELEERRGPESLTPAEKVDLCFYIHALNELYRDLIEAAEYPLRKRAAK